MLPPGHARHKPARTPCRVLPGLLLRQRPGGLSGAATR